MTKPSCLGLLAVLAVAALPAAVAHGAATAREIDTRLLEDGDSPTYAPDACAPEPARLCPAGNGAVDLLSLDVREASTPLGEPVLWFRLTYQTNAPAAGAIHLSFTAAGEGHDFGWATSDGAVFAPEGFAQTAGPAPVGDGHPQALDGMVPYSALGVEAGDALEAFAVASRGGSDDGDRMPGGWTAQGQEVAVPSDPTAPPASPVAYVLAGPAVLLDLSADAGPLDAARPSRTLRIANPLAALPQFVTLTLAPTAGVEASLSATSLALEPGAGRTVELASQPTQDGTVTVRVASDLGAYGELSFAVHPPPPPANGTGHEHRPDGLHGETSKAAPLPLPFVALAAAALLAARRRR